MKSMMKKNGLVQNLGLVLGLILSTSAALGADLIPQIDCSGSLKVLKTSNALGQPDTIGNYQILYPGSVGFTAEVEFAPSSVACEEAVAQLGIKPYVSSVMNFQAEFSKGSPEIATQLAAEIVGKTLSYQLVVENDELAGFNLQEKIVAAQVGPEAKFVGQSTLGSIAISAFSAQNVVFSTAHAPKATMSLSDEEKLANAALIFNEPEFLKTIPFKAYKLSKFLKKTLMPQEVAAKKAYLELVTSTLLTQIEPAKQSETLEFLSNSSKTIGQLISKLASTAEVLNDEQKSQLLLTFPGLLQTTESCLIEGSDELKLGFLKKAQEFEAKWLGHKDSLKEHLEGIVAGNFFCDIGFEPTEEMKALAASALEKI